MLQFTYPGVYTREVPSGVRTVSGAPTSVALFVGPTRAGIDARPIRLQNFGDFERSFGGLSQTSSLSYSVLHFFANGGGEAFVIRVPADQAVAADTTLLQNNAAATVSLTLTSLSSGLASNDLFAEIDAFGIAANPFAPGPAPTPLHDKKRFNLTITDRLTGRVERFGNLTTASANARFAPTVVNDIGTGSKLVKLTMAAIDTDGPQANGSVYTIGTAPVTGAVFASDISLRLSVTIRDAAGAVDTVNSITNLDVVVFASGSAPPVSPLELSNRLAIALNEAIRANDPARTTMEGAGIEVAPFEGGTLLRLRVTPPGPVKPTRRINDATVTITDPAAGTSFLATYTLVQVLANPSRYQLGADYASSQVSAATAGDDGDPNGQPLTATFKTAITGLDGPDPFFNTLCLPDLVRPSATDPAALHHTSAPSIYGEAALICQKKFAFLLIDPPPNVTSVGAAEAWKSTGLPFQSSHAGAWFPNIRVDDPLEPGAIRNHPPSGAVAGVMARTDGQVGVWQAPAGTEAILTGVYGPSQTLSDADQGALNPLGLNCIRQFPIYGTVSFGSRTVDGSNAMASDYKYVPVRRTANYILRSLSEALRWAVHKPNGEQLWSQLRMNSTAFMHGLFRQGAFKGISSRDAYFVLCDASTTTPDDINQGIVNLVIGFAPLKPAEFVVISLRQIVQAAN